VEERQDRTEVAGDGGRLSLADDSEHVIPDGAEMPNATVSVKPLSPVIVIVELPEEPTLIDVGVTELAVIVKSTTLTVR
jgi:hypothetical protein